MENKPTNQSAQEVDVEKSLADKWAREEAKSGGLGQAQENALAKGYFWGRQSKAGSFSLEDARIIFVNGGGAAMQKLLGKDISLEEAFNDTIQFLTSTPLQTKGREVMELFIEFEKSQKKTVRGGIEMYDVKGEYKYLTFSELFQLFLTTNPLNK